ncbi:MAG: hypothetical protein MI976_20215 [Pseudomonadales bacterium]|nr:hypothetical protein [Pseudomonadales bacterium]
MPKVYFAKKQLGTPKGASVHVRYSYGAVFKGSVDQKLSEGVSEGVQALNYTVDYLKNTDSNAMNANFKKYFEKYFLSQSSADVDMLNTLYAVLLLTKNGVANTTIKVYSKAHNDPQGLTAGYVTNRWGKGADQKHRTPGLYHDKKTGNDKVVTKGDIHMGSSTVKNNSQLNNAVLFIHEATHKYANTADFGEQGYTSSTGSCSYRKPGLTTAQALMNADSFGRFAVHFHRAEKGMRQW